MGASAASDDEPKAANDLKSNEHRAAGLEAGLEPEGELAFDVASALEEIEDLDELCDSCS